MLLVERCMHRMFFNGRYYVSGILCTLTRKNLVPNKLGFLQPWRKYFYLGNLSALMT